MVWSQKNVPNVKISNTIILPHLEDKAHKDGAAMMQFWGFQCQTLRTRFQPSPPRVCWPPAVVLPRGGPKMGCMLNSMVRSTKGWRGGFWCLKGWGNHGNPKGGPSMWGLCCWPSAAGDSVTGIVASRFCLASQHACTVATWGLLLLLGALEL